ncbi:hypothetical protein VE04_07894 [Pseudogymnoascus sp. 24MN13]|nr:hypothetical protein VE04_07894 [Pseudogymnoascus sp. 24MN13]
MTTILTAEHPAGPTVFSTLATSSPSPPFPRPDSNHAHARRRHDRAHDDERGAHCRRLRKRWLRSWRRCRRSRRRAAGRDIKALTVESPELIGQLGPAFEKYNEEQFATVKLPGASQQVIVSSHNSLGDGRYFDVENSSSFEFDHSTQKASNVQSYVLESANSDLIKSLIKSLAKHAEDHYPNSSYGVYPIEDDSKIAILLVANKYSPNNFWNGRWRSLYILSPSSSSSSLVGSIKVDVHYYEDGNVRLLTTKPVSRSVSSRRATSIVREIAVAEKKYQENLNKGFTSLSEGAFKGLRRQLPVTRQKVEWDKIAGYRHGRGIAKSAEGF